MRPYKRATALLALLSFSEIVLRVSAPVALAVVVDHALGTAPLTGWLGHLAHGLGLSSDRRSLLIGFAIIGLVLQVLHEVVVLFHGRLSIALGQRLIRNMREQLFAHMQALTLKHHTATPTGDAAQRLQGDTRCIEQIVLRGIALLFSLLTLVLMFCVLLAIDVQLALLSLAIVPALYLWLRFYAPRIAPRADHARQSDSAFSSRLHESLSAIPLTKSHAREDEEQARFSSVARDVAHAWTTVGHQGAVFSIVTVVMTVVGSCLVLVAGGLAVLDGRITIGTLLLVLTYLGYVYGPLQAIGNTTNDMQHAFAGARRVREALAIVPENADAPHAITAEHIRGEVRFDDVSFGYTDDKHVLEHVTFGTRPGEMIALVGPSGAGKSTLMSLLVRFYDPSHGRIMLDGVPIDRYALRSLRQQVAMVLQDPVMTSGTIRDNLRYGAPHAANRELESAARAANAHDFITQLPHGYDTVLGKAGATLSGGQLQQLSIARAFLKDAPIVILDEPTAALDTIAERRVVDAVHRLCAGRTTFVVAHRLSTVREANRILVMDDGRIVADGTHEALRGTSMLYRRLAAQLAEDLPDSVSPRAFRAP